MQARTDNVGKWKQEQAEEFTHLESVMVNKFSKLRRSTGISNETKVKLYETFVVTVPLCTVQSVDAWGEKMKDESLQQKWYG